ncbi:MAG: YggS family pyridoxal phosphate-dependent enzyme [Cyclobacteriaceae bacterium]|nr:YggS family pyridoxal phosphate-dependent enzyme [Cyclobacteriaceae bacterium]
MNTIVDNLAFIKKRIALACDKSGRNLSAVKLLLATKTVSAENIKIVLEAGKSDNDRMLIGENKVQEMKEKFEDLKSVPHHTHFIGHLQTNKIKEVTRYADCIQSVDRWDLAEKLQKHLEFENKTLDVFLQINTSYEESKFGIAPEKAVGFALRVHTLDRLHIKGLMTIGLFSAQTEQVRKCFRLLKNLQQQMLEKNIPVHELSMGMSGDLETAIEEGSTMVRVGTAIFGKRIYSDSYYWNEGSKPTQILS